MTIITPETFIDSHLTLEKFHTYTSSGPTSTEVTPVLSLNTSAPNASPKTGYKIYPNVGTPATLNVENQTASEATTITIGRSNATYSAPAIAQGFDTTTPSSKLTVSADVELLPHTHSSQSERSKIIFPAVSPGTQQTIASPMIDRTDGTDTDTDYVNGIKFSNDAEFTIPNPDYVSGGTEPEFVNVRISDIYKMLSALKHLQYYDNVISALCRSVNYQSSNLSVTNDSDWINAYAVINDPQPPVPTPPPGPAE